jgi:sugar lactone lactonase YvrE
MLIGLLVLLGLLAVAAIGMSRAAAVRTRMATNYTRLVQVRWGQEAAFQYARWRLTTTPAWRTSATNGEAFAYESVSYRLWVTNAGLPALTGQVAVACRTESGSATDRRLIAPFHRPTLYIADADNHRIRSVDLGSGIIMTLAGDGVNGALPDGGLAAASRLNAPHAIFVVSNGLAYVGDTENRRIRTIPFATRVMTTYAGGGTSQADGVPANEARLDAPRAITVSPAGVLYYADRDYDRVRRIAPGTRLVYTVAGTGTAGYNGDSILATQAWLNSPRGVAVATNGTVYIGDTANHRVRAVDPATGLITTYAGTGVDGYNGDDKPSDNARLNEPYAVCLDRAGNLYIADRLNNRIRMVTAGAARIYTVAGTGTSGSSGDGGLAVNATLRQPKGVCLDSQGNLYIADTGNHRVRRVAAATGIITTVAGTGFSGYTGDGVAATATRLKSPVNVCVAD